MLAITFDFRLELLQETLLEFQYLLHMHVGKEGTGGGHGRVSEQHVLEFVIARRDDGGAFVDLRGIEQIEYGETLDGEDAVHTFEAETALAIEKVGDVSLFESGLLGKPEAGEIAFLNALPKSVAEIFLQDSEFHGLEYSMGGIAMR